MNHLLQENYYLRQRVLELERENQHIRLMLAAKTLMIDTVNFKFDSINIDTLSGSLQIGVTHQAQPPAPITLPRLTDGPRLKI